MSPSRANTHAARPFRSARLSRIPRSPQHSIPRSAQHLHTPPSFLSYALIPIAPSRRIRVPSAVSTRSAAISAFAASRRSSVANSSAAARPPSPPSPSSSSASSRANTNCAAAAAAADVAVAFRTSRRTRAASSFASGSS